MEIILELAELFNTLKIPAVNLNVDRRGFNNYC